MSQHITATVSLAGRQDVQIDTHGTGGPGSHITVGLAGVLLWFYDQLAVANYCSAWTIQALAIFGANLPAARHLVRPNGPRAAHPITLAARAHHTDLVDWDRRAGVLIVATGAIAWAVFDGDAFYDQIELWNRVTALAELVLPVKPDASPTAD